jgi:hypothetical protein
MSTDFFFKTLEEIEAFCAKKKDIEFSVIQPNQLNDMTVSLIDTGKTFKAIVKVTF